MNDTSLASGNCFEWLDPNSASFSAIFPHLGLLRRTKRSQELQDRARQELRVLAQTVLRSLEIFDSHFAEDLTSAFIIRVGAEHLIQRFDPAKGEMHRYLFGIMRNIAREQLRSRRRTRNNLDEAPVSVSACQHDPKSIVEASDTLRTMKAWIEALPRAQRIAVTRRFFDVETAERVNYVNLHRGLKRLRRLASEDDE